MSSDAADRLLAAFDLHDFGMRMQRQLLRRTHPTASEVEIDERMRAWLRVRPGAEQGDADGKPSRRFA